MDSNAVELRDKVQRLCASENCNRVIVSLHNVFSSVKEMIQSMLHNKTLRQKSYACPKTVYRYYNMVNYNATNHYRNVQTLHTTLQNTTNHYRNIQTFPYNATNHYTTLQNARQTITLPNSFNHMKRVFKFTIFLLDCIGY